MFLRTSSEFFEHLNHSLDLDTLALADEELILILSAIPLLMSVEQDRGHRHILTSHFKSSLPYTEGHAN